MARQDEDDAGSRWVRSRPWWPLVGAVALGLAALSARVNFEAAESRPWIALLDVAVGLAFVGAAAIAPAPPLARALVAAVGLTWLLGSLVPTARLMHQTMLAITLAGFPTGRPRGAPRLVLAGLAVPVALLVVPVPLVALLFLALAGIAVIDRRILGRVALYPALAAGSIAAVLGTSWLSDGLQPDGLDPSLVLLLYELVLLAIAIGFPVAIRAGQASRDDLANRLLSDDRLTGLDGLAAVIGDALGDADLRVFRWDPVQGTHVDERGRPVVDDGSRQWVPIHEGAEPLAVVAVNRAAGLDDPETAAAVAESVRLGVRNVRLQDELRARLRELEATRTRLIAASDRQRTATAALLRDEVVEPIERASRHLARVAEAPLPTSAGEELRVAAMELDTATAEIMGLVAGVPPSKLGDGGIVDAVRALAARSPVPVTVSAEPGAGADSEVETTFFFVCSESLTNAVKHAGAGVVRIRIAREAGALRVTVSDDGVGGATESGSGLQGLRDRLATQGGRLRVESPPGAGTTVTAWVPITRSSARA